MRSIQWMILYCLGLLMILPLWAQQSAYRLPHVYAIRNAKIVPVTGKVIEKGTLVVRDGVIAAVGEADKVKIPEDATVIEGEKLTVYPGLIDSYSSLGLPAAGSDYSAFDRGNAHSNTRVRPERRAAELFQADQSAFTSRRKVGFTAALVVSPVGIFSGQSALISLGEGNPSELLIRPVIASHLILRDRSRVFDEGFGSGYPSSLMGIIALIRQTFYDTQHQAQVRALYEKSPRNKSRPAFNRAYEALEPVLKRQLPLIVYANDDQDILRVLKIADEFNLEIIIAGGEEAAKVAEVLKKRQIPVLLSLNMPEFLQNYDPDAPPSLATLRQQALAAQNAALLHKVGVTFALTTEGLRDPSDLLRNLRTAITNGLPKEAALEALTMVPARLFGVADRLGSIEAGKAAHLIVVEGELFDQNAKIRYVFVDGREIKMDTPSEVRTATGGPPGGPGRFRRPPQPPETTSGAEVDQQTPAEAAQPPGEQEKKEETPERQESPKPMRPVSLDPIPPKPADEHNTWLIRNATIWTLTSKGTLQNADVLIVDGKIKEVGQNLKAPNDARVVDGTGKHLTPGIIDCHSHTAISGGVNEGTNVCTAEVRIQDVINAEDVNIYRQLAGGTTGANLLHGSANVIGGQNAVIKFRWGKRAEDLLFKAAPPGIKFALGENVKRSNFSVGREGGTTRYPASRMGVEQVVRDRFLAALDYKQQMADYKAGKRPYPPARDLQLDALLEILEGKRLIHCHSYRQDEILMLIRVAEEFGVRIGTFQHVLEGYKVADEIARHGAGASTFSDWWAYKVEAYDAIPFNGALMTNRGVTVSFNSDSSELARRLNLEAAKAVKYGGLSEEESLKLVTLNPAIQLGVDKYIGTIEPGKDADLALWSRHPLSTYSLCEKTFVDGVLYFDRQRDLEWRQQIEKEKNEYLADLRKASFFDEGRREPGAGRGERTLPERGGPPGAESGISGVWKGSITGAEPLPPEGIAFTLTLKLEAGNRLSGSMETPLGTADITGNYNPGTGDLNFSLSTPDGMTVNFTVRVSGSSMTGTASALGQTFTLRGERAGGTPGGENGRVGEQKGEGVEVGKDGSGEGSEPEARSPEALKPQALIPEVPSPETPKPATGVSLAPDYSASRERQVTTKGVYAIVNATIHPLTAPTLQKGTVLIRDGKIEAVGENLSIPSAAQVIDAAGLHLYPGMIDPNTSLGLTEIGSIPASNDTSETGLFNPNARTEIAINPDSELIPVARANGITTAVAAPTGGTLAGMGCVLNLDGWTWEDLCLKSPIGIYLSFPSPSGDATRSAEQRRREWEDAMKPLREFIENARRYQRARDAGGKNGLPLHERDVRFEAMIPILEGKLPLFVRVNSALGIKAALQWAEKERVRIVLVGASEAWKVASLIKEKGVPVILGPVLTMPPGEDFPYDHPFTIPKNLHEAGVLFCFSSNSDSNVRNLPSHAAMAVAFGLPKEEALKALTINPARILGLDHRLGSIEPGKDANLILTTGDPLDIRTQVRQVLIAGRPVDMSNKHTRLYDKYRMRPKK